MSGGGVNGNHNAAHSPSLALKNKIESDPKLLKNSEGNRDDEFLLMAGGRHCFTLARDKNKKDHKKLRRELVDHCPKQGDHKQQSLKHRNKQSGSKCTNHK